MTTSTGPAHERGCLFCLGDGPFTSEEHVFPAGLGNTEKVLPPGVVCDPCNNGRLSKVDRAFLNAPMVNWWRTVNGLETRTGRVPESVWTNATITQPRRGHLVIEEKEEGALVDHGVQPDGQTKLTLSLRGPIVTLDAMWMIQRALFKMGLEFMFIDRPDVAFDERLDPVRAIVLGRAPRSGWLLMRRTAIPHPKISYRYWPDLQTEGVEIIPVALDVFGMVFESEMLARDPAHAEDVDPEQATVYVFAKHGA